MKTFVDEFKAFALRGNVVDLAIGVVIGAAFGAIVTSLVNDIIMPPLGYILGGVDFNSLAIVLREAHGDAPAVTINYGAFLTTVLRFVIIAFSIFVVIRMMNRLVKKEHDTPHQQPAPSEEEVLLREIRDLLQRQK